MFEKLAGRLSSWSTFTDGTIRRGGWRVSKTRLANSRKTTQDQDQDSGLNSIVNEVTTN